MSVEPRVSIHPDSSVLMAAIAARLITKLVDVQDKYGEATVVLTGGTVGIGTLKAVADSPAAPAVDWSKVNFWWGDERFVASDDPTAIPGRRLMPCSPTSRLIRPGSTSRRPRTTLTPPRRPQRTTPGGCGRQPRPNTLQTCQMTGPTSRAFLGWTLSCWV